MKVCEVEGKTNTGMFVVEGNPQSVLRQPTLFTREPAFFFIIMENTGNDNEIVGRYDNKDEAMKYARNIANIVPKASTLKKIEVRHLGKLIWTCDLQTRYAHPDL